MSKFGWFSCDEDTGEVVAKTDVQEDGTVNRYDYTVPDKIKEGHGDKWYKDMDKFLEDEPSGSRDKDDEESKDRPWYGNGYDLGLSKVESQVKKLILKSKK